MASMLHSRGQYYDLSYYDDSLWRIFLGLLYRSSLPEPTHWSYITFRY